MKKNKMYLTLSILILLSSVLLLIKFSSNNTYSSYSFFSIISLIIGILMLNHWSSISYIWTCEVCSEVRILSVKENFIYINIGLNRKYFYCNECGVKRIFKARYRY